MSNWFSKVLSQRKSRASFEKRKYIPDSFSDNRIEINNDYFANLGLPQKSLDAKIVEVEDTQKYLKDKKIEESAITIKRNLYIGQELFILVGRTIIFGIISVQMLIIPFRLLSSLESSFSSDKVEISEGVQIAILGAIAGDFAGLYYIVTRHLFPKGKDEDTKNDDDPDNKN